MDFDYHPAFSPAVYSFGALIFWIAIIIGFAACLMEYLVVPILKTLAKKYRW